MGHYTQRFFLLSIFLSFSLSGFALFGFKKHKTDTVPVEDNIENSSTYCGRYSNNRTVDSLLCFAFSNLGKPYCSGNCGPNSFDCSGFTTYVYGKFGYKLNRSSGSQTANGVPVDRNSLAPGDLVFFKGRNSHASRIGHVGIVASVNDDATFTFIHSANGTGISHDNSTAPYYLKRYVTACRVISPESLTPRIPSLTKPEELSLDIEPVQAHTEEEPSKYKRKLKRIKVKRGQSLYSLANEYDCSVKQLKQWNNLRSTQLKVGQKIYIHLPNKDSKPGVNELDTADDNETEDIVSESVDSNPESKEHIVVKGDNLLLISKKYNCSVDDLKSWNKLENSKVKVGQKLIISASRIETNETKTAVKAKSENAQLLDARKELLDIEVSESESKEHVVAKGENLFAIAMKYGCSANDLKAWNNLDRSTVYPGQKLVVNSSNGNLSKPVYHTVQKGESLYSISKDFQINIKTIQEINNLESDGVQIGQRLRVK